MSKPARTSLSVSNSKTFSMKSNVKQTDELGIAFKLDAFNVIGVMIMT